MMQIIYESEKPIFAIGKDELQYILATSKKNRADGTYTWDNRTFHPNLCNLLDYLAESQFRANTTRVKELKDLEKAVTKVYQLISTVSEELKDARFKEWEAKN
jgi:hypothetical protein